MIPTMKSSLIFLLIIFISLENLLSSPLFQSNTQHHESSSPVHVQPLQHFSKYRSPCVPDTRTTNQPQELPSTNEKISCRTSPSKQQKRQQRFRRSFAYESQCSPVKKIRCHTFTYGGKKINLCAEYTKVVCTALD